MHPAEMEQVDSLTGQITDLWQQATAQGTLLLLPSRLWQLGILVLCIVVAWVLTRWIRPTFHEWIRTLAGRPKWQLRALVVLHRRLGLILFSILIWIAAAIMAEVTPFVSRRFLLELVGTITVAILLVGFAVRLVQNNFLRQIVPWFLWIYVTLYCLGIIDDDFELPRQSGIFFRGHAAFPTDGPTSPYRHWGPVYARPDHDINSSGPHSRKRRNIAVDEGSGC